MRRTTEEHVMKRQREADQSRLCIVPTTKVENRLFSRLKKTGAVVSPWRGMYALSDAWSRLKPDERVRRIVRTLGRQHPSWVFCDTTAALMHGLDVPYQELMPIKVAQGPSERSKSTKHIARRPLLLTEPAVMADGVAVTSLERTVMDCCARLSFRHGLAIADSALRVSGLGREHFMEYINSHREIIGWSRALDPLAWADGRAANGGESLARAVMIEQGFMVPDLQVMVPNMVEGGTYYADFFWELPDGTRVVGELDGLDKYCEPSMTGGRSIARVMSDERRRESRIGAARCLVMRFSFDEAVRVDPLVELLEVYGIPRGGMRIRGR
jgi:hypothetical protein